MNSVQNWLIKELCVYGYSCEKLSAISTKIDSCCGGHLPVVFPHTMGNDIDLETFILQWETPDFCATFDVYMDKQTGYWHNLDFEKNDYTELEVDLNSDGWISKINKEIENIYMGEKSCQ